VGIPDDSSGPTWYEPADIDVDVDSLQEFATNVRRDFEENFSENIQKAISPLTGGPRFGMAPQFEEMYYARQYYSTQQSNFFGQQGMLALLAQGELALSLGTESAARIYQDVDSFLAADQNRISQLLTEYKPQENNGDSNQNGSENQNGNSNSDGSEYQKYVEEFRREQLGIEDDAPQGNDTLRPDRLGDEQVMRDDEEVWHTNLRPPRPEN